MKCISLWQPWASAIPLRLKGVETRGFETKIRGRIGVHAAVRWTKAERDFAAARRRAGDPLPDPLPLGAVVATAVLHDVLPSEMLLARGLPDLELMYGDYSPGRFGWLLQHVVALDDPIPWKGKQGWFDVPDDLFPEPARASAPVTQAGLWPPAGWPFPTSAHEERAC